jgi:Uma2 family endonuclease
MAGVPAKTAEDLDYPTSDGKPMAETDWHRDLMMALIQTLSAYYADNPMVYISGKLLVFYEPGNRRRHVSPDVFIARGVEKRQRPNYLIWDEAKGPEMVIELTSRTTREEDLEVKYGLYQRLRVSEYFLFDPLGEYLQPQLAGHRLSRGRYRAIAQVQGRLPSNVLGLHLESHGRDLRLYDPAKKQWLPTSEERAARAESEIKRLQRELDSLRRRNGK